MYTSISQQIPPTAALFLPEAIQAGIEQTGAAAGVEGLFYGNQFDPLENDWLQQRQSFQSAISFLCSPAFIASSHDFFLRIIKDVEVIYRDHIYQNIIQDTFSCLYQHRIAPLFDQNKNYKCPLEMPIVPCFVKGGSIDPAGQITLPQFRLLAMKQRAEGLFSNSLGAFVQRGFIEGRRFDMNLFNQTIADALVKSIKQVSFFAFRL